MSIDNPIFPRAPNSCVDWLTIANLWYPHILRWALAFRCKANWGIEAASDVIQVVYKSFYKNPKLGHDIADFSSWLFIVSYRVFLKRTRKERQLREHEIQVEPDKLGEMLASTTVELCESDKNFIRAILFSSLKELEQKQRIILRLFFFRQLQVKQIAEKLGMKSEDISRLKYKGLKILRSKPAINKAWQELFGNDK